MRILFISTWFPWPPDNGAKVRVYHLLRALGREHEVTLVSFAFDTARPGSIEAGSLGCETVSAIEHNPFHRSRLAWGLRFLSMRPVVEAPVRDMVSAVARVLAASQFQAVIASTTLTTPYARLARNATLVLEEHNCWSRWARECYEQAHTLPGRLRRWASWQKQRQYEARVLRGFDLCTMVSEPDLEETLAVLDGARRRVELIPNGVDCAYNRPGLRQRRPGALIYTGALTYRANLDAMGYFLAQIYPRIREQERDVTFSITGSTRGVNLDSLTLDESVHLTGYVQDPRIPVSEASVCLVPTRQGGGTRFKILEAMALGTPVVATPKGAEGLDVTHGQDILIADQPEEFAAQVVRLLRDDELRCRLARHARRLVERQYDWAHVGTRFVALVEEVQRAQPGGGVSS